MTARVRRLIHVAVRRCFGISTHILAYRHQHQRTRSHAHPQPADAQDRHVGTMLLRTQRRTHRSRCSSSFLHHSTYTAPFPLCKTSYAAPTVRGGLKEHARYAFSLFGIPTLFSAGRFSSLIAAHCATPAYKHVRTPAHG